MGIGSRFCRYAEKRAALQAEILQKSLQLGVAVNRNAFLQMQQVVFGQKAGVDVTDLEGRAGGGLGACVNGDSPAFVAQCTAGSGGTWNGATESLKRRLSEVYVYADGSADAAALVREGAIPLTTAPRFLSELPPKELSIFD